MLRSPHGLVSWDLGFTWSRVADLDKAVHLRQDERRGEQSNQRKDGREKGRGRRADGVEECWKEKDTQELGQLGMDVAESGCDATVTRRGDHGRDGQGPASREASLAPSAARGLRTSMGPRSILPGHPRGSNTGVGVGGKPNRAPARVLSWLPRRSTSVSRMYRQVALKSLLFVVVFALVGSGSVALAAGPAAPNPLAPLNGAQVTVPFTNSWSAVSDPSGIIAYNWEVSPSSSFVPVAASNSTSGQTQSTVSGLTNGTYFWRVQAVNGAFTQGAWS